MPRRRVPHPSGIPDVLVFGVGGLLMAVMLSELFGYLRRTTGG